MLAIGLMSGTSLDGIDAAIINTDGKRYIEAGAFISIPYSDALKTELLDLMFGKGDILQVEKDVTKAHIEAVKVLLDEAKLTANDIDVIGFHGQTIHHRPEEGITWQLGDGLYLAHETMIDVVNDFRKKDMAAGGQGAPLVPVFHAALVSEVEKPVAVLNIGGVANVTWIGEGGEEDMLAFDTGPGNALIDDWVRAHTGESFDANGNYASRGRIDEAMLEAWLQDEYFNMMPPKSLDRNHFAPKEILPLSLEDGAATFTEFTARTILNAQQFFPQAVSHCYVAGGGRHNGFLMQRLQQLTNIAIEPIESLGFNGDALEAEAFGYLAVRARMGLPLTFPSTTGAKRPATGGVFCQA